VKDFPILVVDLTDISKKLGVKIHGVLAGDLLRKYRAIIDLGEGTITFRVSGGGEGEESHDLGGKNR